MPALGRFVSTTSSAEQAKPAAAKAVAAKPPMYKEFQIYRYLNIGISTIMRADCKCRGNRGHCTRGRS